jgi:hypothetical protein
MGREMSDASDRCMLDIKAHLRVHGATNWSVVRTKWPQIHDRTFWRLVKKCNVILMRGPPIPTIVWDHKAKK